MKGYNVEPEMTKATMGVGDLPSDIRWHSGVSLPVRGDYLVELIVEEGWTKTLYVYWDGENPFVRDNNDSTIYQLEYILSWAYDGDD